MIRGRIYIDISRCETVEPGYGIHARFLSREGARDARRRILIGVATLPRGGEVVIHVGRVRPCAEIDQDEWANIRESLNVTFESAEPDVVKAWIATASGPLAATA